MTKIYVEKAKLTFTIEAGKIEDIENGRRGVPNIDVDILDATFGEIYVADRRLYLDWLAMTDLATWIHVEYSRMHWRRQARKLLNYFPGSITIKDLMRATMRCIADREHFAQGDGLHFIARVRSTHVDEMETIKSAFMARYGHLVITHSSGERPL